jgi:CrcB protein
VSFLFVAVGAAVGAPLRYMVDRALQVRHDSLFPWGTFVVNVVGSLVLGVLVGTANVDSDMMALLGTGLCGALTTYSTFGFETARLFEQRAILYALVNIAASIVAGLAAAFAGVAVATAIWS